ncbi:MAG: hypothetical protein K0Q59_1503 [Paenibacillus sp.]|nr:hypothetical protein [Paenibacillus sp.]
MLNVAQAMTWKRILLAGCISLTLLSGPAVSAVGRPYSPVLLQPQWSPLAYHAKQMAKQEAAQQTFAATMIAPMPDEAAQFAAEQQIAAAIQQSAAEAEAAAAQQAFAAAAAQAATAPAAVAPAAAKTKAAAPAAQPQTAKKAAAVKQAPAAQPAAAAVEAAPAAAAAPIVTAAGDTITPKKAIQVKASAYTGSAEENGGYAGKDYFGNSLQVGSIAVDPKVIPLGSTVYITGYTYDGLPAGGMLAKAVDIGGSIKGNRVDVYVPDTNAQAKKFGVQNITVYTID